MITIYSPNLGSRIKYVIEFIFRDLLEIEFRLTNKVNDLKGIVINYSNKPCCFYDKEKLVLAHKMYGFPYYDKTGEYGISNRDNYVIVGYSDNDFERLKQFLSLNLSLLVFETTRYRMKYLERYAFEFIPDITKIPDFPDIITDDTVSNYFQLTDEERLAIKNITKKEYSDFK
mgnify:CR=1 FL=1